MLQIQITLHYCPPTQNSITYKQTRHVPNTTFPILSSPMTKNLNPTLKRLIDSNQSIIFSRLQQKSQYAHPYPHDSLVNFEMSEESTTKKGGGLQQEKEVPPKNKIVEKPDPPEKPEAGDCCGSGCVRCIWDIYYEQLEDYNMLLKEYEAQQQGGLKE